MALRAARRWHTPPPRCGSATPGQHRQQARRACSGIARDGGQLAGGRATRR
jgi:hypothetical protein